MIHKYEQDNKCMSRFREAHFDIDDSPPSDDDPRQSTKEL